MKYMLITVIEMNITTEKFDTLESAQARMKNEFESFGGCKEKIEDNEASLGKFVAWIEDGNNHDNYSWVIVEI